MAFFIDTILKLLSKKQWVPVPLCDWHRHGGGFSGPGGMPDPHIDAFAVGVIVAILSSVGLMVLCCPFLVVRVRRIRDIFWIVPAINLGLYFASAAVRVYPGGFLARFRPPGLWYTLAEVALVLVLSLLVAIVTALVQWTVRKVRLLLGRKNAEQEYNGSRR